MIRIALSCLVLMFSELAAAAQMQTPRIAPATVSWQAAAAALGAEPGTSPEPLFAKLNEASEPRFSGISKSPVPVLLPFDTDGFAKAMAGKEKQATPEIADRYVQAGFRASLFFLTGPGGYDVAFALRVADVPEFSDIRFREPVYVLFSGLRAVYELEGPPLPDGEPVKELEEQFPGIRRYLHEHYVRYAFERYGVTYVAATYCQDRRPRPRILTCKQADRIVMRFLRALKLAGGSPQAEQAAFKPAEITRPEATSKDFTYYSPGSLIPGTGLRPDVPGRADYTVYARMHFPMKEAPSFANSQSFNNWGDCDFTGRSPRRLGKKGMSYSCKVNGRPLTFDESAGANYSYPWRDNFCEHRYFQVGQCPGGTGHQGQDIRPSYCKLFNEGADRCLPYQHDVVAVRDGAVLRARRQEAVFLFVNDTDAHIRLRYMHMSPTRLDEDGITSGRVVREGDLLGKVGTFNEFERGTTYHLHFDMQVPTRIGWVFVDPYMTLVAAYEHLIGARGTEIKPDDPVPPVATVPPVIEHPSTPPPQEQAEPTPIPPRRATQTGENAGPRAKPAKSVKPLRKRTRSAKRT